MPERADTLEAIGLIIFAPLLYSMVYPFRHWWRCGQWSHRLVENLPIEEQQRVEGLVLGGGRHFACDGQIA